MNGNDERKKELEEMRKKIMAEEAALDATPVTPMQPAIVPGQTPANVQPTSSYPMQPQQFQGPNYSQQIPGQPQPGSPLPFFQPPTFMDRLRKIVPIVLPIVAVALIANAVLTYYYLQSAHAVTVAVAEAAKTCNTQVLCGPLKIGFGI